MKSRRYAVLGSKVSGTPRWLGPALLLASQSASALAQEANFPTLYAVHVWGVPLGRGEAVVVGPVHAETCESDTLPWLKSIEADMSSIPPDWRLYMSHCVRKEQLPSILNAAFICTFSSSSPIPKAKISKLWFYDCFWRTP